MGANGLMPASTGIGVSPVLGRIAMDVFAAWGGQDAVAQFQAAGNQRSACEYGSAFARAARVRTPGGVSVFCSGTPPSPPRATPVSTATLQARSA